VGNAGRRDYQRTGASVAFLVSGGLVPLAFVAAGLLLEAAGTTPTVLVFSGIMVAGAAIAIGSRAFRDAPDRPPSLAGQSENV